MTQMNLSMKHKHREQTCVCQGGGRGSGAGKCWEFETSICKLPYIGWINNKVLLYSTGKYIQNPEINHNGKEYRKEYIHICVCVTSHFDVHQRLTQHCKLTMLQ